MENKYRTQEIEIERFEEHMNRGMQNCMYTKNRLV